MGLFDPGKQDVVDPRRVVIGELTELASAVGQEAASAHKQTTIVAYSRVIKRIEDRIEAIRRGAPLRNI